MKKWLILLGLLIGASTLFAHRDSFLVLGGYGKGEAMITHEQLHVSIRSMTLRNFFTHQKERDEEALAVVIFVINKGEQATSLVPNDFMLSDDTRWLRGHFTQESITLQPQESRELGLLFSVNAKRLSALHSLIYVEVVNGESAATFLDIDSKEIIDARN